MKVHTFQHNKNKYFNKETRKYEPNKWRRPDYEHSLEKGYCSHTRLENYKAQLVHFIELGLVIEDFEDRTEVRHNDETILVIEK